MAATRRLTPTLLALGLFIPPLPAQVLHLARKGGTLGKTIDILVSGTPNQVWFLMPSFLKGPTPLKFFDPRETRSLSIGMDLAAFFAVGLTATQPSLVQVAVPNLPVLHEQRLRFQAFTVPGKATLFGALSNPISCLMGNPDNWALNRRMLAQARWGASTAALLPGSLILLIGGTTGQAALPLKGVATTSVYRSDEMDIVGGPKLWVPRVLHRSVALGKGRLLVCGGLDGLGRPTAAAEIYDVQRGIFALTGSLPAARAGHTATLLPDGRVFVAGGATDFSSVAKVLATALKTTALYDPVRGVWTAGPALPAPLVGHAARLLRSGKVLITGGFSLDVTSNPVTSRAAFWFDPKTNTITTAPSMPHPTALHSMVELSDGTVLVAGGGVLGLSLSLSAPTNKAALFDPVKGTWTALSAMNTARAAPATALLPDGRVLFMGGFQGSLVAPKAIASVEAYVPATKSFAVLPAVPTPIGGAAALELATGQALFAGGLGGTQPLPLDSGLFFFPR